MTAKYSANIKLKIKILQILESLKGLNGLFRIFSFLLIRASYSFYCS
jgi:hypothetical protein